MTGNKTISKEIKRVVVYQYYGRKYKYKNEFGSYTDTVGGFHTNTHIESDSFTLILKPLSSISDEDAHKIGMLMGCSMIGKALSWGKELTERIMIERHLCVMSYSIYQFLQSKGYDLPNYLLGNKTLHECNLCCYE